jgi:ribokinase
LGRVFVAGSINMDVVATASRHPRVGETVAGQAVHYFPGGKGANQAVAAAKLGAPATLIGRLGTDAFGQQLRRFLAAQGIDLALVKDTPDIHTGTAIITIADADNTIVVVPGANACVSAEDVAAPVLAKGDVAVSQFEIPQATIGAFFKRARAAGATTILNPAPAHGLERPTLELADILTPNEGELAVLVGGRGRPSAQAKRLLGDEPGDRAVLVTLGANGTLLVDGKRSRAMAAPKVDVIDTVGAGDTLNGALAAGLAGGLDLLEASRRAGIAASLAVTRPGARGGMPTTAELEDAVASRPEAH